MPAEEKEDLIKEFDTVAERLRQVELTLQDATSEFQSLRHKLEAIRTILNAK